MSLAVLKHVDLLNNLLEQRRSVELLPDADCRMAQKHPEWKNRIKNESLYSKLAVFLSQVEQILESINQTDILLLLSTIFVRSTPT
uniref:Uncharacterized protein n=1 Tax=Ditylenchus dipsaci TaxID=166011 RepID=A0A915ERD1_9BILA